MRQTDKRQLKELLNRLTSLKEDFETFKDNHQEWMDERDSDTDGRFLDTPTGERAQEEQDLFDEWFDTIDTLTNDIEEAA